VSGIVDTSSPIRDGNTPLHLAAAAEVNSAQTTRLMLKLGAKVAVLNERSEAGSVYLPFFLAWTTRTRLERLGLDVGP
jgi:ankyrin repeat protein